MIGIFHIPVDGPDSSTACGQYAAVIAETLDMVTCTACRDLIVVPKYLKPEQGANHGSAARDLPDN